MGGVSADDEMQRQWARVAERVKGRAKALGFATQAEMARRADVSKPTARIFLTGERRADYGYPNEQMRLQVCRALGWTPDSIDRILDGGEPELSSPDPVSQPDVADVQRQVAQLERLTVRLAHLVREKLEYDEDLSALIAELEELSA